MPQYGAAPNFIMERYPESRQTLRARQGTNSTNLGSLTATDTFAYDGETWTVFEDLSQPEGIMTLVSGSGVQKSFTQRLEATNFLANRTVEWWLGLNSSEINLALDDMLADVLLKDGEPVETTVRDVVPFTTIGPWNTFLGTVQANDTMRLTTRSGSRSFYPTDFVPSIFWDTAEGYLNWTYDGLVGGWKPASRQVFRRSQDAQDWFEITAFGDVDATDPIIVHVWFRTSWIVDGAVKWRAFNHDYPLFPPARVAPEPADFYTALLRFGDYWEQHMEGISTLALPDQSWVDLNKHTFALELVQRYSGVYPKYGAYDRDYAGSEYDGFQDTFTSSVYANLVWGRFDQARKVLENYFDMFVSDTGDINMRGPETAQFGMSLSLAATYAHYTGDIALLQRYKEKILGWVNILTTRHDESLKLPPSNSSYGLIAGWSESDSALAFNPEFYTRPYFNNNAFAARGLKDLGKISVFSEYAAAWNQRAEQMIKQTVKTMTQETRTDMTPPYVPILPGQNYTVRESNTIESPSPQQWSHRVYSELLQAAVLPSNLTDTTIDSMRAWGITSLGVVGNVWIPNDLSRDIIGFISYGYALSLLLQDRVDEFVLFLYTHRYHVHSRGQWIPSEVAGTGIESGTTYCQPAGHSISIIMRAALVFEHPDDDVLFLGRGVPATWVATGNEASILGAPTRWGLVDYSICLDEGAKTITAKIGFEGKGPVEGRVKLRLLDGKKVKSVTVNGRNATIGSNDDVVVKLGDFAKSVTVIGRY